MMWVRRARERRLRPSGEVAGGLGPRLMAADRIPELFDPFAGRGDGVDEGAARLRSAGWRGRAFAQVRGGCRQCVAVGLVDDEDVGDFEEVGLLRLHPWIAPPVNGDVGSMASTATRVEVVRMWLRSALLSVLLPAPGAPVMLVSGRRMTIAAPKTITHSLFAPPSFAQPAASRQALVQLREDIAAVLSVADAVVDLDHRFGAQAH